MPLIIKFRDQFSMSDMCRIAFAYHKMGIRGASNSRYGKYNRIINAIAEEMARDELMKGGGVEDNGIKV